MKLFLFCLSLLFLASCAHHRDVRPGADGVHRVVVSTDDKEEGSRSAISQANHYCAESKRSAVFIEEKQDYVGDMSESSYQTGKRMGNVAKVVGGTTRVFGGEKESNLGGIVGLGGVATDAALGKGYAVTMRFKCQ